MSKPQRSTKMLRPKKIWEKFGIGRRKFEEEFRLHDASDPYIPGTTIPRVRLVKLGPRAVAGFEDEIDEVIEAFRKERDAN
jgi:predicted DNA-binding transcriptional regulator AlpA